MPSSRCKEADVIGCQRLAHHERKGDVLCVHCEIEIKSI